MKEPPFRSIAIVGLGLIGGSIALAVRERWPEVRVLGVDRQAVLAHALGSGAIDRAVESIEALPASDLVILAAPVQQNIALLGQLGTTAAIVTDVGGTKRAIVEAARQYPMTFVGGHPLGGGERGGFAFARGDLFKGRPWILTGEPVESLARFVEGLGARVVRMSADEHDRLMAFVSHLPQLVASALMSVVGNSAEAGLPVAGRGLFDTTRLASSPADVWRDICLSNEDNIGVALDVLIAGLTRIRGDLKGGADFESIFADAARWRAQLLKQVE